jgi:hypothetical protein
MVRAFRGILIFFAMAGTALAICCDKESMGPSERLRA